MRMIYDPIPFLKLVQKILVGNYEPIMRICGKRFIINLHNLKMLLMLWIKNKFSECQVPLHQHEGHQWKTSGDGSAQARRHGGAFGGSNPQIFFVPLKFCCAQINLFQTYDTNWNLFPIKMYFPPKP